MKVNVLPAALISERNVSDTMKLDAPDPMDAAATPRPRSCRGNTSDTRIHATGPMLNAKQVMETIRQMVAITPGPAPNAAVLWNEYASRNSEADMPLIPT